MRIGVGDLDGQLTVDEVISDGGTVTQTVIVDIATLAVEVFGNSDQVANGGGCANVREILSGWVLQANLSEGFPPFLHNVDLGVEVFKVGGVFEAIVDVNGGIDQRSVPKFNEFVVRVETIDPAGTESRSEQRGCRR